MSSVIMIAYFFPPEGNAGTYRPLRFVRYLPTRGWNASVVTLETNCYERYDPSLLALIPNDPQIVRVRNRDPWQAIQARRGQHIQAKLARISHEDAGRVHAAYQ